MTLDAAELARRTPVWIALSELWLDTELTEGDLRRSANVMRQSGYSVEQLREIHLFEVAPVVFPNLLSVAGEWAGFDEAWLVSEACRRAGWRSPALRLCVKLGVWPCLVTFATGRYWIGLVALLDPRRQE